ncbi:MAG: hypothetical protein RMM58_14960 [Chloroflexota bacterium]|nr:hypothetical protein [Dehalococcoidia bacterium]MDW8255174.1 hypothetical protein [Chloroflexota bacterium]
MSSPAKPRLLTADGFQRMGELGFFRTEDRRNSMEMAALGNQQILRLGRFATLFHA